MSKDDSKKMQSSTVPPPPGEADAYSASTVVGPASAELLALIRTAEEQGAIGPATDETAARVASAREAASNAAAAKSASGASAASERTSRTDPPAAHRPSAHARHADERGESSGLPPILAIVLVFAAAAGVLAALVR